MADKTELEMSQSNRCSPQDEKMAGQVGSRGIFEDQNSSGEVVCGED